eukprot:TRINITY_DN6555_c0_g1_i1.p2 TRINITY_DN6555_c0_g1~~TRINITY_DN6555_c0_g1_i1.p2  ORF type:complete len:243 (+),score=77.10 TRINITY_DN6555_c0_g1_i1:112-840(+)
MMDEDKDMDSGLDEEEEVEEEALNVEVVPIQHEEDGSMEEDLGDANVPQFAALSAHEMAGGRNQFRRIPVPPNRFTPLKENWMQIYEPIVEHMKLQIRFNPKRRAVELKTSKMTPDAGAIQKAADFVRAFMLGFETRDAIALLRLDDLYIDSFEIRDVRSLEGDHLSRAIGRICGQGGKTKFTIENTTKTRIVVAETKIHVLGSFQNIKIAKDAVVRLILGSPPGKVYTMMRNVAHRQKERF